MHVLKPIIKTLLKMGIIGFITLLCFEICYRFNLIDFYKAETLALNSSADLKHKTADILVFGDSFSATSKDINYVDRLREHKPESTILNFSIPGIGIRQLNTFAASKIKKYKPKTIIYQIYVGNDLLDVERFKNLNNTSFFKYAFWQASNTFLSLGYLNHKASVFKPKVNYRHYAIKNPKFIKEYYNKRSKNYITINSNYLEQTLQLEGAFAFKYSQWLTGIKTFLNAIPKDTKVYFLWIPHCTQVNNYYLDNFKYLGATFTNSINHLDINYPFYKQANKDLKGFSVKHLNTLSYFKTKDSMQNRIFFANDPHLNKYGNDILAKYIIENNLQFQ